MPANIAHMLIAHKALERLKTKASNEVADFANMIDDTSRVKNCRAYMNLGSIGPDLFYYVDIGVSVKEILIDRFMKAKAITPWSYHLHAHSPNEFPLKLIELVFRDVVRKNKKVKLDDDDIRKLAYVAGHLTHIAGDQIIHPAVNSVAGPYYRSGKNRIKHRECEVFQDYFLYQEVYRFEGKSGPKYEFLEQKFHEWINCVRSVPDIKEWFRYVMRRFFFLKWDFHKLMRLFRRATFKNTDEWFRYFLQRGFVETYGTFPPEEEIEDSVDNLRLTLWMYKKLPPYENAKKDYDKNGPDSGMCKEYIKDVNYIKHWSLAVELAVIYIIALYEIYDVLKRGKDFTEKPHRERFRNIVSDEDLSCPLGQNICDKAYTALISKKETKTKCKELFA